MSKHAEELARQLDEESFEPSPMTSAQLLFIWRRLIGNPRFVASTLHRFQQDEDWSDTELAEHLGTDRDGLYRTGLAGTPRPTSALVDIGAIAAANGVDAAQLIHIFQAIQARDRFRSSGGADRVLAAARDHGPEERTAADHQSQTDDTGNESPEPDRRS